jgi:hypothetical protein
MFVCADGELLDVAGIDDALDTARACAARHARVGISADAAQARRMSARALPGMVVCRRDEAPPGVACYPLTASSALVRA